MVFLARHAFREELGEAVLAVGTRGFEPAFLSALGRVAPFDLVSAFRFDGDRERRARCVFSRGGTGSAAPEEAARYVKAHWRRDPLAHAFTPSAARPEAFVRVSGIDDITDPAYRRDCYERSRIGARAAIVLRHRQGCMTLRLYRRGRQRFVASELGDLAEEAAVLASLLARHDALLAGTGSPLTADVDPVDRIAAFRNARLSPRERDVMRHVLAGLTTEGIALELGVKPSTVITFRKRAYEKLGIATRSELFALAIGGGGPA